jgi:thiopurine S-methyltransferase
MSLDMWSEFWKIGRTGFHSAEVHDQLLKHGDWLLEGRPRVGVPLCGKSLDLVWLAERAQAVVGVELVAQAVQEFMVEQRYTPVRTELEGFTRWTTSGPTILQGDIFGLTGAGTGPLQAVWDRAALVAIQPSRRKAYVEKLVELLDAGSRILLVCWDADRPADVGPPFRVRTEDVMSLYSPHGRVELVASEVLDAEAHERVRAKGLQWVKEDIYQISL